MIGVQIEAVQGAWSSLVVEGDDGCIGPSGIMRNPKNYAANAWQRSILV